MRQNKDHHEPEHVISRTDIRYLDPRTGAPGRSPLRLKPAPAIRRRDIEPRERSLWRHRAARPFTIRHPITGSGIKP